MEATVREMQADGLQPDAGEIVWKLTEEDLDDLYLLLPLAGTKICDYQQPFGRDLMCTATAPSDKTAVQTWNGRLVAPTSRAVCSGCALPESDILCSNLLHPSVNGMLFAGGQTRRDLLSAMCDLGRNELNDDVSRCRAAGHACWERHVIAEPASAQPVSPLGLPEQFDVLDAYWRLRFGSRQHLIDLHTVTGPASLALGCSSRADFESRLSALADIVDRLVVDDALLPAMTEDERKAQIKGSLDKLKVALLHQLPAEHSAGIERAVRTLRKVRQARNAIQHGTARDGGLTARLRELGIHDAPPNWEGAWDAIRVQVSDALSALRNELRSAVDANPWMRMPATSPLGSRPRPLTSGRARVTPRAKRGHGAQKRAHSAPGRAAVTEGLIKMSKGGSNKLLSTPAWLSEQPELPWCQKDQPPD
jgi:hypothetical protein